MKKPLRLMPIYKDIIWGGNKLTTNYNKVTNLKTIAESWELSIHPKGVSYVDGTDLSQYLKTHPDSLGNQKDHLEIMIKMIDTNQPLSIQVHPDDEFAFENEGQSGKIETWLILEANPNAYIYYGLNRSLSKDELRFRITNNTILEVLNKVFIRPQDVFIITPGTIHAIGENITLLEIQQSSDVTYRLYDHDRKDACGNKRELHVDKALSVCKLEQTIPSNRSIIICDNEHVKAELIDTNKYYTIKRYQIKKSFILNITKRSFVYIISIDGDNEMEYDNTAIYMVKGVSYFIPAQDTIITFLRSSTIITVTQ